MQRVNEAAGCTTLQGQDASSYAAVLRNQQAEPSATWSFSAQAVGYPTPPYGLDSKMVDVTHVSSYRHGSRQHAAEPISGNMGVVGSKSFPTAQRSPINSHLSLVMLWHEPLAR